MNYLLLDLETIGFPSVPKGMKKDFQRLEQFDSARIIQVACMTVDNKFNEISTFDSIVKREGFEIKNVFIHHITNEISDTAGKPIKEVLEELEKQLDSVGTIIIHNSDFDYPVLQSECFRLGMRVLINKLSSKKIICSMKLTTNTVKAKNKQGRLKWPSLSELYKFATGEEHIHKHNAYSDVADLYTALRSLSKKMII